VFLTEELLSGGYVVSSLFTRQKLFNFIDFPLALQILGEKGNSPFVSGPKIDFFFFLNEGDEILSFLAFILHIKHC
jgi:hypothetical protein